MALDFSSFGNFASSVGSGFKNIGSGLKNNLFGSKSLNTTTGEITTAAPDGWLGGAKNFLKNTFGGGNYQNIQSDYKKWLSAQDKDNPESWEALANKMKTNIDEYQKTATAQQQQLMNLINGLKFGQQEQQQPFQWQPIDIQVNGPTQPWE